VVLESSLSLSAAAAAERMGLQADGTDAYFGHAMNQEVSE
jgi:hypothetical protein